MLVFIMVPLAVLGIVWSLMVTRLSMCFELLIPTATGRTQLTRGGIKANETTSRVKHKLQTIFLSVQNAPFYFLKINYGLKVWSAKS